ncbi:MAG: helix-turn-helix domain-containing protein [Pyrinomonadaceae bacterium]
MSFQEKTNLQINQNISYPSRNPKVLRSKEIWWTPVWNGLLLEPNAKHYKAIGRAVWLYLYLLIYANRQTGKLFRRLPTIERDTGIGIRTIRRWTQKLKQNGYIETRQTGRSLEISITKWKPIK